MKTAAVIMGDTNRAHPDPRYEHGINLLGNIPYLGVNYGQRMVQALQESESIESVIVVTDTRYLDENSLGLRSIDHLIDGGLDFGGNVMKAKNLADRLGMKRLFMLTGDIPHVNANEIEDALYNAEASHRSKGSNLLLLFTNYKDYVSISGTWHDTHAARPDEFSEPENYVKMDTTIVYLNDDSEKQETFDRYMTWFNFRGYKNVQHTCVNLVRHLGPQLIDIYPAIWPMIYQHIHRAKMIANPLSVPNPPRNAPLHSTLEKVFSKILECNVGLLHGKYMSLMDPDRPDQVEMMVGRYKEVQEMLMSY